MKNKKRLWRDRRQTWLIIGVILGFLIGLVGFASMVVHHGAHHSAPLMPGIT